MALYNRRRCGKPRFGRGLTLPGAWPYLLHEFHWFFVDGQDDAAGVAVNFVPGARRIDDQGSGVGDACLIPLRTGKNQNMFVSLVFMQRHLAMFAIPNQCGGRPGDSIPVEAENVHPPFIRLPRDLILVRREVKNVFQFKWKRSRGRFWIHTIYRQILIVRESETKFEIKGRPLFVNDLPSSPQRAVGRFR
jgi:hypothetical protein